MYSKSTMILIIAVALISLTCGSPIDSAETRADTFSRTAQLNPDYKVTWDVDRKAETVKFTVEVNTVGYVGFGISKSGTMTEADIVIGGVRDDKTQYFDDRYSTAHGIPEVDEKQNYDKISVTEAAGKTTLVFSRKFVTGDSKDVDIKDEKTNFIWAIGSTDSIEQHATRGKFEVNILEEPSSTTPTTTSTSSTTPKGGAVNLQISSLSCALTVFLIAAKYFY